jgi:hypothetical protein
MAYPFKFQSNLTTKHSNEFGPFPFHKVRPNSWNQTGPKLLSSHIASPLPSVALPTLDSGTPLPLLPLLNYENEYKGMVDLRGEVDANKGYQHCQFGHHNA